LTAAELLTAADEMTGYTSVIANLPEGDRRMADWDGFVSLLRDLESFGYADAFSASFMVPRDLSGRSSSLPTSLAMKINRMVL
jgi:hypothetical protein